MNRKESIELGYGICAIDAALIAKAPDKGISLENIDELLDYLDKQNVNWNLALSACDYRNGWNYIIEHLDNDITLATLQDIHEIIGKTELTQQMFGSYFNNNLGVFRRESVIITGCSYIPKIPNPEKMHEELMEIQEIKDPIDRGLSTIPWIMRTQPFINCNKRTATLVGNEILLSNGIGAIAINGSDREEFMNILLSYYKTNFMGEIKEFLYENCLYTSKDQYIEAIEKNKSLQKSLKLKI